MEIEHDTWNEPLPPEWDAAPPEWDAVPPEWGTWGMDALDSLMREPEPMPDFEPLPPAWDATLQDWNTEIKEWNS